MNAEILKVRLDFTEPVLGTCPGNPELHEEFIASRVREDKGPRAEQAEQLMAEEKQVIKQMSEEEEISEQVEKTSTVFARDDTGLFAFDYQLKGFLKEALRTQIDLGYSKISRWTYKRLVDSTLFVYPRRIYFHTPQGDIWRKAEASKSRPLRAETMRGERIALANSEMLPAGTWLECEFHLLTPVAGLKSKQYLLTMETVKDCLDYGKLKGFSQWRSGSFGRFLWHSLAP